jgi:predicted permease
VPKLPTQHSRKAVKAVHEPVNGQNRYAQEAFVGFLVQQIRYVVRKLLRSPGFTTISVLTLAVGIGANTAIFSVVNGVLLRPLPYTDADELVGLWHSAPGIGFPEFNQSETSYTVYKELNRTFVGIGLVDGRTFNLTDGGDPIRVRSASATSSLFRVLGAGPVRGRGFNEQDDQLGGPLVVILSDELWKGRFGSNPNILGRTIDLDGRSYEVVGVMPPGFAYPEEDTQLWIPHRIDPADLGEVSFSYDAIGRLNPGVTLQEANADLNRMLVQLPELYPGQLTAGLMKNAQMAAHANPMHEDVVGDIDRVLWILLGTVGFILLIACANVANLFLVRAESRQKEVAVRTALGASRGDLIKYFLTESTMLAVVGGVVGLGFAYAGIRGLIALSPENLPRLGEVGLHGTVLAFTAGISVFAGLLFGAAPTLRYTSPNLVTSLKEGGRGGSSGRETHRARDLLVVSQVALALVLLVGSGLMARSFWALRNVDPGFDSESVLTLRLSLPPAEYPDAQGAAAFYQQLLEDIRALPAVQAAGANANLPMTDGQNNSGVVLEDFPLQQDEMPPIIRVNFTATGYFEAMGIPLREGRTFQRRDHEEVSGAVVVSAGFAERFWPGESALGKRIAPGLGDDGDTRWYTIVGVVGDVRDDGMADEPAEMIYYPTVLFPEADDGFVARTMSIAIRAGVEPTSLVGSIRQAVWSLNPRLPLANVRTMGDIVSGSMARTAFTMLLLGIAAGVALLLGTVGSYGVIAYVVSQRTREIGVRMALGARQGDVSRMVVRQGVAISAVGVAIGLIGAFALTRLMAALLYGVSATDPMTFAAVSVLLFAVTVLASYVPARRAAGVNPVEALHYE